MEIILVPPIALLIYGLAGFAICRLGKSQSPAEEKDNEIKRSLYASGEEGPKDAAIPGYKPFLITALFFAIIHLAVLVVGMGNLSATTLVYLGVLIFGLIALILG